MPDLPFACTGKIAFESPRLAHSVNGRRNGIKDRSVYRCSQCGLWHLGTPRQVIERKRGYRAREVDDEPIEVRYGNPWLNWR